LSTSDITSSERHDESDVNNNNNNSFFRSSDDTELFCRERSRISTGSKNVDYLLSGGGLEPGTITQFFGGPGMGKTHLCHLLAVVSSPSFGVLYIDTEGTFREEKIQSITQARKLVDWKNNIQVARPKNCSEQESCIEEAACSIAGSRTKLIIIDSMMFHYKAEYSERSALPKRTQKLNIYMHRLHDIAKTNNLAVVITNHSTSDPHNEADSRPYGYG
jgi:DNA repair protein RadA